MKYLEKTAGQLACQLIKDPESLLETFEQLFSALEGFRLGHESITGGDEGNEDFFQYCPLQVLEDIEMAMQLARRHSDVINRFCEDIDKGRGPSMKVGIRLISLVDRGKKPTKLMVEEWHNWDSDLRTYVEFFKESIIIDYLVSEYGAGLPEGRRKTASVQEEDDPGRTSDRQRKQKVRRNAARDSQWYNWRHTDGLTDAQIRDRWDSENPNDRVPRNNVENGLGVVASAIKREDFRRILGTG